MPMSHPVILGRPVGEYERLLASRPSTAPLASPPRPGDLAYTLCVVTGSRDVRIAREPARSHLPAASALVPPAAKE